MYKKIILSLMFLPVFSSSESLCMDPVTAAGLAVAAVATATGNITVAVIDNTCATTSRIAHYYCPSKTDIAIAEAAQFDTDESRKKSKYLDREEKYQNCLAKSKADSAITEYGVPVGCQDIMMAFVLCGGNAKNAVAEMTATFNEFKKR